MTKREGSELVMTFGEPIKKLSTVKGRLFAHLADGQIIDITGLLGDARH